MVGFLFNVPENILLCSLASLKKGVESCSTEQLTRLVCFVLHIAFVSWLWAEFWHILTYFWNPVGFFFFFVMKDCAVFSYQSVLLRSICKYKQGNRVYATVDTDLVHASSSVPTSSVELKPIVLFTNPIGYVFLHEGPKEKRCQKQELIFSCTKRKLSRRCFKHKLLIF